MVIRDQWRTKPLPKQRTRLVCERCYSSEEFERIKAGRLPESMDDKWFIFYEEPWLHLHRSWTGFCVYQVRFQLSDEGVRLVEALANRDPEQYRPADDVRDALFLMRFLDRQAGRQTET